MTSILTALLKAAAVGKMPAEKSRHRQVALHSYAVAMPTKLKIHYEVLQLHEISAQQKNSISSDHVNCGGILRQLHSVSKNRFLTFQR